MPKAAQGFAALCCDIRGRTQGRARITGCRLDEQFLDILPGDDALVEPHVERASPRKRQLAGFCEHLPQIGVEQPQAPVLKQLLD